MIYAAIKWISYPDNPKILLIMVQTFCGSFLCGKKDAYLKFTSIPSPGLEETPITP
jgi:hypothetical protein